MSRSVGIEIHTQKFVARSTMVVEGLVAGGWSYNDHGSINLVPLGNDVSNWQSLEPQEWVTALEVIHEKDTRGETIGISLIWEKDGAHSGGELLMFPHEGVLILNVTINRRRIPDAQDLTDYSWYLQRMAPSLTKTGLIIEYVKCSEHI